MNKVRQEYGSFMLEVTSTEKGILHKVDILDKETSKLIYRFTKKKLDMFQTQEDVMVAVEFIMFNYDMGTLEAILTQ